MIKILLSTAITLIAAGFCTTAWAKAADTAPWRYAGPSGPENWGELKSEYGLCKSGKEQSPIDIQNAMKYPFEPVSFSYHPNKVSVLNNGHTIQVSAPDSGSVSLPTGAFSLVQIHFHAPAEEKIEGRTYPLGAHLVHRNDAGELAIVALMFEEGAHNTALEPIFAAMPRKAGGRATLGSANIADLLPVNHNAYAFMGSLTKPPCTEGVRWNVLTTAVQLSPAQLEAFRAIYPMNARPVQPLNSRSVVVGH
ncbi:MULTISPECIES: carbonic anhydrase [unclassified Pseudomonas]|uniref:carbonic anhydrase n=1 Tax=unclassified Pseudomonas TaxID=196821 RepID=UPI00069F9465|nr:MULTISPECIES: carbonic anhydrase family protein [unclassified Pseudomonas]WPN47020.1 carbonic anhydrase family protein [Pseudomonas sp. P8_241]